MRLTIYLAIIFFTFACKQTFAITFDKKNITNQNVLLYVTDPNGEIKFKVIKVNGDKKTQHHKHNIPYEFAHFDYNIKSMHIMIPSGSAGDFNEGWSNQCHMKAENEAGTSYSRGNLLIYDYGSNKRCTLYLGDSSGTCYYSDKTHPDTANCSNKSTPIKKFCYFVNPINHDYDLVIGSNSYRLRNNSNRAIPKDDCDGKKVKLEKNGKIKAEIDSAEMGYRYKVID